MLSIGIGDIIALFSAAKSAGLFGPRSLSDDEIKNKLNNFRLELKNAFDAEQEQFRQAELKVNLLADEWSTKAIHDEDRKLVANQIRLISIIFENKLIEVKSLIPEVAKIHATALSEAKSKRPATYEAAEAWVIDGRRYGALSIHSLEILIGKLSEVERRFR